MYNKRFSTIDDVQRRVLRHMSDSRINQREFAQELGIHEITVSRFMNNTTPPPKAILNWFGLDEVTFYERKNR
jgi:transcriptional regulator with XRE-family HTH domain